MSVKMRQRVEHEIVAQFVKDTLAAGYRLAVSLERGYDHEDMLLGSTDPDKILEEATAGDDCHVFIQPAKGPTIENNQVVSVGWVYLVFGNDGWDVISDYLLDPEIERVILGKANAIAESYSD